MQQTATPTGLLEAIWPVVSAALTPELVGAVAVTLAATHIVKILAEHWLPHVTDSAAHWRAFCVSASVAIGAIAGAATWLLADAGWFIVPIVSVCSGPAWVLIKALIPRRLAHVRHAFMTSTDRKYAPTETP